MFFSFLFLFYNIFMKKIIVIAGTRPEAVKIAPVVKCLQNHAKEVETLLCSTGQHREMLIQAFSDFELAPDIELDVMTYNQSLSVLSSRLFSALDDLLTRLTPDAVLVQGDTTTVQVAATTAFYHKIPIAHIEAGLRSDDIYAPYPEEFNRRVVSLIADWHFAPTELSRQNLLREGIQEENILVTGNTVIDSLLWIRERVRRNPPEFPEKIADALKEQRRIVLVTGHRRENFTGGLAQICRALQTLAYRYPENRIIFPVHLNPHVRKQVHGLLAEIPGTILCEPLDYKQFVALMDAAYLIISDSGGIQEEAPSLGKPVLVTRDVTERPEGVQAGVNILVGPHTSKILHHAVHLLDNDSAYNRIAKSKNPYGDGCAAMRIYKFLARKLELFS